MCQTRVSSCVMDLKSKQKVVDCSHFIHICSVPMDLSNIIGHYYSSNGSKLGKTEIYLLVVHIAPSSTMKIAGRKLPGQEQLNFSVSYDHCV